jgi:hypothetical protein
LNHNDLYHLIQIAGLYLFRRGALLSRDAGDAAAFPGRIARQEDP